MIELLARAKRALRKEAAIPNLVYFAVPHPKHLTPDEFELWKANVSEALQAVVADANLDVNWSRTLDTMADAFGEEHGWGKRVA